MRILVSGATGLVGRALRAALVAQGDQVVGLSRSPGPETVVWNPASGQIDLEAMESFDAVVHLAGESVAGYWTAAKKTRIRESRIQGTTLLSQALAGLAHPPRVFVCASAIGFYGDAKDQICTESSPPGHSFLAEVAERWEECTQAAEDAGIRTVRLRFGIVLAREGGALKPMLLPARWGLGGPLGSGKQYWSWISLADTVRAIQFAIEHQGLAGSVNAVSPEPIQQREFARVLGKVLRRWSFAPAPAWSLRLLLGQMADGLLLASCRAIPQRLLEAGFEFRDTDLEQWLRQNLA